MSDPVLVIARAQVRPDARALFIAAAQDCIAATRREHGCLAYDMHESVSQPGHFIFVESWEQREHVDAHMRQPHLLAFLGIAGACVTASPVIEVIEPRSVDRL
jgi:quinol monooxygenase YgiN